MSHRHELKILSEVAVNVDLSHCHTWPCPSRPRRVRRGLRASMMVVGALELLFGPMRVAGWRAMHVRGIAAVIQVGEWDVRPERRMLEESVGGSDDGGARRQIAE